MWADDFSCETEADVPGCIGDRTDEVFDTARNLVTNVTQDRVVRRIDEQLTELHDMVHGKFDEIGNLQVSSFSVTIVGGTEHFAHLLPNPAFLDVPASELPRPPECGERSKFCTSGGPEEQVAKFDVFAGGMAKNVIIKQREVSDGLFEANVSDDYADASGRGEFRRLAAYAPMAGLQVCVTGGEHEGAAGAAFSRMFP